MMGFGGNSIKPFSFKESQFHTDLEGGGKLPFTEKIETQTPKCLLKVPQLNIIMLFSMV